MSDALDFTIVGAGAIGGILGAHLARGGHRVSFIEQNTAHVAAIRDRGLHVGGGVDIAFRPEISTPADAKGPLRRVLLAVKSPHTETAVATIAPLLAADGYVVSLQNGLEEKKIARHVGEARTIGAFLTFGGFYKEPGEIVYGGPGSFHIGELDGKVTARVTLLQQVFSLLQPVEITSNIFGYLWAKLALGAVYFGTAVAEADVLALYAVPRYRRLFGALAREVVAVANAHGITVENCDGFDPKVFAPGSTASARAIEQAWQMQIAYWNRHPNNKVTGIWRDLAIHKRRTEVDHQIGPVIEHARALRIAVPKLTALQRTVHEIEAGRRAQSNANLDELLMQRE